MTLSFVSFRTLWAVFGIGTPSGLNLKIDKEDRSIKFKVYDRNSGLPDNYIHSILEDNSGDLWIGTNKGIVKFNPNERIFTSYNVNDGLKSNSFMENVAAKDKQGYFYFGSIYGLNTFHPDSIKRNGLPRVVITNFQIRNKDVLPNSTYDDHIVLNKAIEYSENIHLLHNQNTFTIQYTAINFKSSSQYSYRYKLTGLDEEWSTSIDQENITYSNLKPGNYTFMLKMINEEGTEWAGKSDKYTN